MDEETGDGNRRSTPDRDRAVRGTRTPPTEPGTAAVILPRRWNGKDRVAVRPSNAGSAEAPAAKRRERDWPGEGTGRLLPFSSGQFPGSRRGRSATADLVVWNAWAGATRPKSGERADGLARPSRPLM